MEISGLVFWVQDNTISIKFYKKLGFEIVESNSQHSIVALGTFQITLVSMRDDEEFSRDALSSQKGQGLYIYLRVQDVDSTYSRLQRARLIPVSSPRNWEWGNREFIIKDPDGYKLCFWQKIS